MKRYVSKSRWILITRLSLAQSVSCFSPWQFLNKDQYGMCNNRLIERLGISVHCKVKFIACVCLGVLHVT